MYVPATWGGLCRELFARHERAYRKYMAEVIATQAARWTEIREWANDQRRATTWWEKQSGNWQRLAEEPERAVQEQQKWISDLERGKVWLEERVKLWRNYPKSVKKLFRNNKPGLTNWNQGAAGPGKSGAA